MQQKLRVLIELEKFVRYLSEIDTRNPVWIKNKATKLIKKLEIQEFSKNINVVTNNFKKMSEEKKVKNGITNEKVVSEKTYGNTTASQAKDNVSDIKFWGNGDTWKLISKAWSEKEGWMKSTKAMEIPGAGCLVQVTTQHGNNIAEAVTFVPGVIIREHVDDGGKVLMRSLGYPKE